MEKRKSTVKYPKDIDKQCIPLCDALNFIPSIRTLESCCGHGKDSFKIWFTIKKIKYLTVIGRVFDRRYGGIEGWVCEVSNTDISDLCPTFFINSGNIIGNKTYSDSKKIAKNIYNHLAHEKFCKEFL